MKFTKEDAYKHLVSRLVTNKGQTLNISERSINEMLDTLIPLIANEETELTDFVDKVLPTFKSADLNIKNDVTVGIKEYQGKNPPAPNTTTTQTVDDANADLLKRIETLENQNKQREWELKVKGIKSQLINKLKELGVKSDKWLESLIANVNINEDFNVEEKAKGYLELYNTMQSEIDVNVTPQGANGSGKPDYISNSIQEAATLAKSQSVIG